MQVVTIGPKGEVQINLQRNVSGVPITLCITGKSPELKELDKLAEEGYQMAVAGGQEISSAIAYIKEGELTSVTSTPKQFQTALV